MSERETISQSVARINFKNYADRSLKTLLKAQPNMRIIMTPRE